MALGDQRGSNNGKVFENTYFSRIRFKDYDKKTVLGFKFKNGMLVLDISKEKDGFQYESLIEMYITPIKAKIFYEQIKLFESDLASGNLDPNKGYGINAGMGEIVTVLSIHTTESGGKGITIGKVDNSGSYTTKEDFEFNSNDFHYGLTWNNLKNMDVSKTYYNDIEMDMFKDVLKQFIEVSSGAVGYAVADLTKYDLRSVLNKMNPIYDKLGIERGGQRTVRTGNFFDNAGSAPKGTSNHKSYDELEDELPFE